MQHWLDQLTDLAAIPGDESTIKTVLGDMTKSAGFSGYAYLDIRKRCPDPTFRIIA